MSSGEIQQIRLRLAALDAERRNLEATLVRLERQTQHIPSLHAASSTEQRGVSRSSPTEKKVGLFRQLFAGRSDVFPIRWNNPKTERSGYSPACAKEWVKGVCGKPQIKCGACPNQAFIPVSDAMIERHLRGGSGPNTPGGDFVAGVYPMLLDETCCFLAADFDRKDWAADALALMETCDARNIPAALERSRSGNGGHVWIFFSAPVPARLARQLGAALLTQTMERRPEIGFTSYDRLFLSQDTMPAGGFGNLIALPLQRRAREKGNSVFIDTNLQPYGDQWAFLSALPRLEPDRVSEFVGQAERMGKVLGIRMPVEDEDALEPWRMTPSRQRTPEPVVEPLPIKVRVVVADQIYIDRRALPASMTTRIMRVAAFQNPEFYRAQAMRMPAFGKPRIISCAELHEQHIGVPRGCLDESIELLRSHGIAAMIEDLRMAGTALRSDMCFRGLLQSGQVKAFDALVAHDCGVLAATTAFGKTVIAAALIAQRARNTLVLVHRRELLTQWVERLKTFLDIDPSEIGIIGGGRRKPTGIVDVAIIQSLVRKGEVSDLVADYGHVVVDECHHLSAASFELVASRLKARYVLGLSATVARKDGHQPIIFMQCGPIRHRVDARVQAAERGMKHRVRRRETPFVLPPPLAASERLSMPAIYTALAEDEPRNDMIFDDVLRALEAKRSPVVLSERRDHLDYLERRFSRFVRNLVVLRGGMSAVDRRTAEALLRVSDDEERLILATGRYIGEGFDDQRLDTLFLTMPISWKGTLAQYVGRLHRQHARKTEVLVVDYVDGAVPVLMRMAAKRNAGYRALGYHVE